MRPRGGGVGCGRRVGVLRDNWDPSSCPWPAPAWTKENVPAAWWPTVVTSPGDSLTLHSASSASRGTRCGAQAPTGSLPEGTAREGSVPPAGLRPSLRAGHPSVSSPTFCVTRIIPDTGKEIKVVVSRQSSLRAPSAGDGRAAPLALPRARWLRPRRRDTCAPNANAETRVCHRDSRAFPIGSSRALSLLASPSPLPSGSRSPLSFYVE